MISIDIYTAPVRRTKFKRSVLLCGAGRILEDF